MHAFMLDDSRMPLRLGSALRVPSYAYGNWGIPPGNHRAASEAAYQDEFAQSTEQWMRYVEQASERAGLRGCPQLLRNENANAVATLLTGPGPYRILDIGAGAGGSVLAIHRALPQPVRERTEYYLVDGAAHKLEEAERALAGIANHRYPCTDLEFARHLDAGLAGSFDLATSVAGIHAHAYLDEPLRVIFRSLKPGGSLVTADWHNSMWEHPARVYTFLETLEWPSKRKDLDAFAERYPHALQPLPDPDEGQRSANREIKRFWRAWAAIRFEAIAQGTFNPIDDPLVLEGHRPHERYLEEMEAAGFTDCRARVLRPPSALHVLITARKPA